MHNAPNIAEQRIIIVGYLAQSGNVGEICHRPHLSVLSALTRGMLRKNHSRQNFDRLSQIDLALWKGPH